MFNLLHGTFGEDGDLQALLDRHNVFYTGDGAEGSRLAFNKILAKQRFVACGVPTAEFVTLRKSQRDLHLFSIGQLDLPLAVKIPCEGSSIGVWAPITSHGQLSVTLERAFQEVDELLVERYIPGREFSAGILGCDPPRVLNIAEVIPAPGESHFSFPAKHPWLGLGPAAAYVCPAHLLPHEEVHLREVAVDAHNALGLKVCSRVDLILDKDEGPKVLELNTIPGMTACSLLPLMAAKCGMGVGELCLEIIRLSHDAKHRVGMTSPS